MILCVSGFFLFSCDAGIKDSPDPGTIRIIMQSNPSDTSIVIVPDTLSVTENDFFGVTVFQGKAYKDSMFAILYHDIRSTTQEDITYNIIKIDDGEYRKYTIFESYVPPGSYNRIQFGLKSSALKFSGFDVITVETPDETKYVDLNQPLNISENSVTEINVQISPFKSIDRYRDTYQFTPVVEIISVTP